MAKISQTKFGRRWAQIYRKNKIIYPYLGQKRTILSCVQMIHLRMRLLAKVRKKKA